MPLVPVATMAALVAAFIVKHYLADFFLQTGWMVRGKEAERGWLAPLAVHAGCHGMATLGLAALIEPRLWWLAPIDFAVHLGIDRTKALVSRRAGFTPEQVRFWWLLGLDQMLHHLTDLGLVVAFLTL